MFEVIITKGELYDKCENVEQLYDNFYYPLLVEYNELKKQNNNFKISLDERQEVILAYIKKNEELKQQIIIMEKYFELIHNISSFDYDGYNDVAGLKVVIDELNRLANLGRACNTTEPIYERDGVKFNILLQKLSEQKIGDDK